jgi:DNA-binding winged helix-turn-helix (wHTH) protein
MNDRMRHCYCFGPFRLDTSGGVLFKDGNPLPLPLKAAEVLSVLVESLGRPVSRKELTGRVWRGIHVEEANLTVTISLLRKALGDSRGAPRYIETIPKRG